MPSASDLCQIIFGLQTIGTPRGHSHCVIATQRLVPYTENMGYASNPRCFLLTSWFPLLITLRILLPLLLIMLISILTFLRFITVFKDKQNTGN